MSPTAYVGQQIARIRIKAGMTQQQLADAIGLNSDGSAISRIENGHDQPRLEKLIRIAEALDVPLVDLLPV